MKIFVFWRKNVFLLPTGECGKDYIDEMTRLLNAWIGDSALKNISFKAIMIMPSLLLQKPSKESKAKDHKEALERRFKHRRNSDIDELIREGNTIQSRLPKLNKKNPERDFKEIH